MPLDTITERPAAAGDFLQAFDREDWDAADALVESLNGPHDVALTRAVGALHMQRHRWSDAAEALARITTLDASARLQRTLCLNLAAMKTHRPAAYRTVLEATANDQYRAHRLPSGQDTVARITGERTVPLCSDPAAQVQSAMTQLKPAIDRGDSLAILSIGDGHVLAALAAQSPELFLGRQQPILLIEPDPHLLLASLLIHDFSGTTGPIEQDRVLWYVGPSWSAALRLDVLTDRYLPFPKINIKQGGAAAEIETTLMNVLEELGRADARAAGEIDEHYAAMTPADYAHALAGKFGRAPRVLLLTTRFSTVLQHSTRDAEDAFRRLGCETSIIIEPTPHHLLNRSAIRRTLADFKPDLVMQIDHHRFEHGDLFPPGLPFVNWIQDLLPHLMTPTAGQKLGGADFVLTPSLQRWVDDFAYPESQCLEFRKLTRVPARPAAQAGDDDRVVYVSNWSQSAEQITAELLTGATGTTRDVIATACGNMVRLYEEGGHLASPGDVRRLLEGVLRDVEATADESLIRQTTTRLSDRLNNLLYRQQGLTWAAAACHRLGLRLEIYGNGWDRNPRFSAHAAGTVAYGRPLENLTRQATANLILEPFMCLSHQRLLDALAAGGFCLLRDHPTNRTADVWIDLLSRVGPGVATADALRAGLRAEHHARYNENFAECERLDVSPGQIDHVATIARLQRSGFIPITGHALPLLDCNAFNGPDDLVRLLGRAARDRVFRADVAAAQRKCVENRYSYHAGMKTVLEFVGERLGGTPVCVGKAA